MAATDLSTIEALFRSWGLEALLPVRRTAQRLGCTVWDGRLTTPFGDADVQIQVYPLASQPESIADIEEEITALTDASSSRVVAREMRNEEWGILVTVAREDEAIAARFFDEGSPEERTLTYHPQLDRILGGDYFHQVNGNWLKACLGSVERAMQMAELLKEAQQAYEQAPGWPGKLDRPMAQLVAVLEIPAEEVEGAPATYDQRALTQFMISSPEVIQIKPPEGAPLLAAFARQLFGFLRSQHKAGICYTRDAGCCIRPEFLFADGSLTDVYFAWRPTDEAMRTDSTQKDLWNGLLVTCELAGDGGLDIADFLTVATEQYTGGQKLTRDVQGLISGAARGFASGETRGLVALLTMVLLQS